MLNIYNLLSIIFLIFSIISCWILPKYYLFAPIYLISYCLAYLGGIASYSSLFPLTILVVAILGVKFNVNRMGLYFCCLIISIIGIAAMAGILTGFNSLDVYNGIEIERSKTLINLSINYSQVSVALFILGVLCRLNTTLEGWKHIVLISIPWIAFTSAIYIGYIHISNLSTLDIKIPTITISWLLYNFFFITIPQEALFRGFIQHQITENLKNKVAPILAIIVSSILFASIQTFFIPNFIYFLGMFIISSLYGIIFHYSGSIECSTITHFVINMIQFFFYSYPFLH